MVIDDSDVDFELLPYRITNVGVGDLFSSIDSVAPVGTTGLERFVYADNCVINIDFYDRLKRVENCGKSWQWDTKDASGVRAKHPHNCGDYHYCPYCLSKRAYKLKKQLEPICAAGELYIITTTPADWCNMRKTVPGAANYYCLPQADSNVVFINQTMFDALAETKYAQQLEVVSIFDFDAKLNWNELVTTPEYPVRKRVSGKLGELEPETVYGEMSKRGLIITRDGEMVHDYEVQEIDNEAMDATADLDPHTVIELQVALDTRTDAMIAIAKEHGCRVGVRRFMSKLTIAPNSLHWLHSYTLIVASRERIAQRQRDFAANWAVPADLDA